MFKNTLRLSLSVSISVLAITLSLNAGSAQNRKSSQSAQTTAGKSLTNSSSNTSISSAFLYIGNSFSSKYHKADCEFARKINPAHVVFFGNDTEARKSGSKPCNWCLPSWSKNVHGSVLSRSTVRAISAPKGSQPLSTVEPSPGKSEPHRN